MMRYALYFGYDGAGDNVADGVCAPLYADLHLGCNELSELPQKLLTWRAKQ